MSCTASESMTNVEERTEERREYYRALEPVEAQVLMLERQSKTHRLGKSVREEVRSLADTVLDVAEQGDNAARRIRHLETLVDNCAQQNKDLMSAVDDLRTSVHELRCAIMEKESQSSAPTENDGTAPSSNCLTEPFVALWRGVARRKQRTAYSRFERGELDGDERVIVDDNEFCVTTQFSKTE